MRTEATLVIVLAIFALPTAFAFESVTIDVPDVSIFVGGRTVDLGEATEKYTGASPVRPEGKVTTQDVEASTAATCTLNPRGGVDAQVCRARAPGAVRTDIVDADVGLRIVTAPEAADEGAPLASAAAVVTAAPLAPAQTALIAAAAAGASLAFVYAVWRVLKWTGLAALMPLYSHISDDEILDDPNRAAIYRLIQAEAGISTKDVAERLGLAWGTVTHHLGKLEKRRFVVSKKYGKYRRYFANGEGGSQEKDAVAVLRLDRTGDVAALIRAQPGLTQKAVSIALGVSSSTILWHVKRLEDVQLVRKVRDGKLVRYYPVEPAANAPVLIVAPGAA